MNPATDWIAVVGEDASAHGAWEDAVQHVAAATGAERVDLWFRPGETAGLLVFDGWTRDAKRPVGWITDPTQYQAAKSRGELEESLSAFLSRARASLPDPAVNRRITQQSNPTAMTKTQTEPVVYIVNQKPNIVWRAKKHDFGALIEIVPQGIPEEKKLARFLAHKQLRAATVEDKEAAAAAALVDKASASAAAETTESAGGFALLDPLTIAPSPVNPRRHFADASMQEMTDSVREKGVRVAINVRPMPAAMWFVEPGARSGKPGWFLLDRRRYRPNPGTTGGQVYEHIPDELFQHFFPTQAEAEAATPKYEIIAGERRWRAARYAGSETIRAIVETMEDLEAAELQVIENDQREDLTPLESAAGYQYLLSQPGYDVKKLIKRTGKSKTIIYERLKLLELPKIAQDAVVAGRLPMSTAQLIGAADEDLKEVAAQCILGLRDRRGNVHTYRKGAEEPVETYREAEGTIDALKRERDQRIKLEEASAALKKKGLTVLEGKAREKVVSYGCLAHNSGHVAATEVCPRDPQGRTWEKILKDDKTVERRAVVVQSRGSAPEGVLIFEREQANAALKKLGLWDADGSKVAKEKLEKQRAAAKQQRAKEQMQGEFDAIGRKARKGETAQIRAVLTGILLSELTYDTSFIVELCERLGVKPAGKVHDAHCKALEKYAASASLGDLTALLAVMATMWLGSSFNHYTEGRKRMMKMLGIDGHIGDQGESPDVRTDDETADEEEEAEVPA